MRFENMTTTAIEHCVLRHPRAFLTASATGIAFCWLQSVSPLVLVPPTLAGHPPLELGRLHALPTVSVQLLRFDRNADSHVAQAVFCLNARLNPVAEPNLFADLMPVHAVLSGACTTTINPPSKRSVPE
jgi:hypothetical protein